MTLYYSERLKKIDMITLPCIPSPQGRGNKRVPSSLQGKEIKEFPRPLRERDRGRGMQYLFLTFTIDGSGLVRIFKNGGGR
jgi:hypothetical protein